MKEVASTGEEGVPKKKRGDRISPGFDLYFLCNYSGIDR
jgi:hypothetical protein